MHALKRYRSDSVKFIFLSVVKFCPIKVFHHLTTDESQSPTLNFGN